MNIQVESQRLFFALWPDDETRKSISDVAKQAAQCHQGKLIHTDNFHLTLSFLGNVETTQRECVEAVAESINMMPFHLCLENLGIFPRPKVLWLGIKNKPSALMQLATSLSNGARDCGIKLDGKSLNPHVSLMRKAKQLHEFEVEPIHWDVNQFCLVQSISRPEGVEYRVIKSWGGF